MAAGPSAGREDRNLALALARFARALRVNESASASYIELALAAGRGAGTPTEARALAYGRLAQLFLAGESQTRAGATRMSGVGGGGFAYRPGAPALTLGAPVRPSRSLDALAGLAPLERAALLLVAVENFSYSEAARMLALEPVQMAQTMAIAREAFAARLAAGEGGRPRLRLVE